MYGTGNGTEMQDYLINFATNLDPNGPTQMHWPRWKTTSPNLITFLDGSTPVTVTQDTYRALEMEKITNLGIEFPI